jgi:phage head maturation protease
MNASVIKGMSTGLETLQSSIRGVVSMLKELRLWEISVVTFPMNGECDHLQRQEPQCLQRRSADAAAGYPATRRPFSVLTA